MRIVRDVDGLTPFFQGVFVPTMGALHAGHEALIRRARVLADDRSPPRSVVVSVFVNPTQFNEKKDFETYPRDLETDAMLAAAAGADCVFAPPPEVVYPPPPAPPIPVPPLPRVAAAPGLEDRHRPGHFAGVCQVCKRLFNLVRPAVAVFGEKDWQQLKVIEALVAAEFPDESLRIVSHPIVREQDGLAMSSRNVRLSPLERRRALSISRALVEAGRHAEPSQAEQAARVVLMANRLNVEYAAVRDALTLEAPRPNRPARVLIAAWAGGTRLIDNAPWPGFELASA